MKLSNLIGVAVALLVVGCSGSSSTTTAPTTPTTTPVQTPTQTPTTPTTNGVGQNKQNLP